MKAREKKLASAMADELERSTLEIALIPAPFGRCKVRVPISQNPRWYAKFCAAYARVRGRWKPLKTYIKRRCTLRALRQLAAGKPAGVYGDRLMPVIHEVSIGDDEQLAFERAQYRKRKQA